MADQNFSVGVQTDLSAFERGWNNAIGLLGRFAAQATVTGTTVAQAVGQINGGNFSPIQRGLSAVASGFNSVVDRAKFAGFQISYYAANANSLLTDAYRRADQEQKKFDAGLGRLGSNLQSAGRSMSTYFTAPLIAAGLAAFGTYAKIDSLNRALTVIEGPAGNASARFKELREVAALPGLGLEEAVQGDVRLRAVGLSAKLSKASLLEFGNAIALTGGGKAELGSVTTQLGQMAAKGKVLAQDLRPIIEAAPAVATSIKKIFGTIDSEQISDKLKATGKTSTDFIELLTGEMSKLERVTGGPKNAIENLQDSLKIASFEFGTAADKSLDLTGKLNGLGTFINNLSSGFKELSPGTQATILGLVGIVAAVGPLALALGTIINLIPTITTGFKAMQTAMLAISSPIGIIVGAVAVVGALTYAIVQFNQSATFTIDRTRLLAEANKEVNSQIGAETANLQSLITVARDETISKEARANAIKKINDIAPEYLGNINADTVDTNAATTAIERYTKVLGLKAQAQVFAQRQADAMANSVKASSTSATEYTDNAADRLGAAFTNFFKGGKSFNEGMAQSLANKGIEKQRAEIAKANQETKLWGDKLFEVNKELSTIEIKPPKVASGTTPDFTKVGQASGIKKAKEELKELADQIQSGNLAGQDTSALQAKYDTLAKSIESATDSTKKHRAVSGPIREINELTVLEEIYKRLSTQVQVYASKGKVAPEEIRNQLAAITAEVQRAKQALQRTNLDFVESKTIKTRVDSSAVSNALTLAGGQSPLPKSLGTLVANWKVQAKFDLDDKAGSFNNFKREIADDFGVLQDSPEFDKLFAKVIDKSVSGTPEAISQAAQILLDARNTLKMSAAGVLAGIGESIGQGQNPLKAALGGLLDILGGYLIQLGTALLLSSATLLAAAPLTFGLTAGPGIGQQIAGAGLIIGGGVVKGLGNSMKFAKGAVFDEPTFGLFGEYAGAGRNREIATPEKLMAETFRGELQKDGLRQAARPVSSGRIVERVPYISTVTADMSGLHSNLELYKQGLNDFNGED